MNPALYIRPASANDLPDMLEIYRPFVENTVVSFEYETPSSTEFQRRYNSIMPSFPWLVCDYDGVVTGYAYASRYHARAAYQWDAELSIYVHPEYQGRRIGLALYHSLLRTLTLQGFFYAHALVALPNDKSMRLHQRLGFKTIGVFEKTGFKHGAWHDLAELRIPLAELPENPIPPRSFGNLDPHAVVQIFREEASQVTLP